MFIQFEVCMKRNQTVTGNIKMSHKNAGLPTPFSF